MAGYFRSSSLAIASQGFSAFVAKSGKARFIVGADLDPVDVKTVLEACHKGESPEPLGRMLKERLEDYGS